ncbi:oligosaccharide flippase family protein [Methanofollis formosanus]|nr:oligosaccharide flippase family protein [Methanofollis formosanus]
MGEEVIKFVRNVSYVGLGTMLSSIFSFSYNLIAGRVLGPSGYGNFTLVQSIAMFLYIPMLLGLNSAMIKYCAESRDQYQQRKIMSTTYSVVICLTIVSVMLYDIFKHHIAVIFSVDQEIIELSIIFAVIFVFYTLTTSSLCSLHLMKDYAIFQPMYGITLLSVFLFFIHIQFNSFKTMVYANCLAYGIVGSIIVLIFLKKYLAFTIDRSCFSTLWKYSSVVVIGGLSFTLYTNIDRIIINYYMDVESVGIYGIYYYASFTLLTLVSGIFITVFFPTASKSHDKRSLYDKLNKTVPYLMIFGTPITLIGEYTILRLFGEGYPIQLPLMLIFAIAAMLVTWYGIYAWFFSSEGIEGSKLTVSGTLIIAIANIILNIMLIPQIGLYGAIGATALAFALGLYYNFYHGKRFLDSVDSDIKPRLKHT